MIGEFQVFREWLNRWPAKNGKSGGESYDILLVDVTTPREYAIRGMFSYTLTEEERRMYGGKLEGRVIRLGVQEIGTRFSGPFFRGAIVEIKE